MELLARLPADGSGSFAVIADNRATIDLGGGFEVRLSARGQLRNVPVTIP